MGNGHRRLRGKKADYLLRYQESLPIAIVEAKAEALDPAAGLQQAKDYAQALGLHFAYSSNGHGIVEWDFTTNTQTPLTTYPTPDQLWQRLCAFESLDAARPQNPLLTPYCEKGDKPPRYYQEVAINRTIEAILRGQKRILNNLATGTGKTVIAFQTAWKLWQAKWNVAGADRHPRVLFLADRIVLRDQAYNTFEAFEAERDLIAEGKAPMNRSVYFGIYQSMFSEVNGKRLFEQYPKDFFDLIIIDECHRSGFGSWKAILNHFETAVQVGMTATPKRTENIDTYKYFGEPVFTYSLGQGIDDGFLATYKVHRTLTNFTRDGLVIEDVTAQGAQVEVPDGANVADRYDSPEFERKITMPDHVKKLCEHLNKLLHQYGRMEKTMVFCVNMDHALQVTEELNRLNVDLNVPDYAVRIVSEEGAIAVAQPEDAGRSGSHRFITCVPKPEKATPEFLCTWFLTEEGMAHIRAASPGAAGRNRTLGITKLMAIPVPVPPLHRQQEFAALRRQIAAARGLHKSLPDELYALQSALLDKAFKGEL